MTAPVRPIPLDDPVAYAEALSQTLREESETQDDPEKKPKPPKKEPPMRGFWDRLWNGEDKHGLARLADLARSASRGVQNAFVAGLETVAQGAAKFDYETGLGELLSPGFEATYRAQGGAKGVTKSALITPLKTVQDKLMGKKSDDVLAGFSEGVSQFTAGFVASGPLKLAKGWDALKAAKGLQKPVALALRGAVVDAALFDPYEAQLAELAAKAPVPGLRDLGKALSVDADENPVSARAKRAAAGIVPSFAIDALATAARVVRSAKLKGNVGLKEAADRLQGLHDGTVIPDGAHFVAREQPDGTAIIEAVSKEAKGAAGDVPVPVKYSSLAEAQQQTASMDMGVDARKFAGKADDTLVEEAVKAVEELPTDPTKLDAIVENVLGGASHQTTAEEATKLIEKLAPRIKAALDRSVQTHGLVKVEESFRIARNSLGLIPEDLGYNVLAGLGRKTEIQSVQELMAGAHLDNMGKKIAQLDEALQARPHDDILKQEAADAVNNWMQFADEHFDIVSERGRAMRMRQELDNPLMADLKAGAKVGDEAAEAATGAAAKATPNAAKQAELAKLVKAVFNKTDTDAVTATDFSLAREAKRIRADLKKLEQGDIVRPHDPETAIKTAQDIKADADAVRSGELEISAEDAAEAAKVKTSTKNPINELSRWLDEAEETLDDKLNPKVKEPKQQGQELFATKSPVSEHIKNGPPVPDPEVAGMKTRNASSAAVEAADVRNSTRMFRLSGGKPVNLNAVVQGMAVQQQTGNIHRALEVFTNALLSGPATVKTVLFSGQALSTFEATARSIAGAATGNTALFREGVDILWGNYRYIADNLRIARMALNEGRSIINPAPAHHAIGGLTGDIVRLPGHVLMAGDEFTRVANYRSFIRAKSLRKGRELGLEGQELAAHVDADLRAAFDAQTGIATIPEALNYAERSTLSGALVDGFGAKFAEFVRNTPALGFLSPFTKAATNVFRTAWMNTPLLNRANKQYRTIMAKGGEEAAVLQAKVALSTSVYAYGVYKVMSGEMTGRAPRDPQLRQLWLKNHQEYSIKFGDEWISYRRTDPFGMMLGLVADGAQMAQAIGDDRSAEDIVSIGIAAITANILTPTYMKGVTDFLGAVDEGDPLAFKRYARNLASSFVPRLANTFNDDPYVREVKGFTDAFANRVPGWSETLDAQTNIFGEKILNGGQLNRSAMFPRKSAKPGLEDELLKIGKGFANFNPKLDGQIDLKDRKSFDNGTGKSPYARMMELVSAPEDGRTSLREAIEKLVSTPEYQNASAGDTDFPGGLKWQLVALTKQAWEQAALGQVFKEYPLLLEEKQRVAALKASSYSGEDAKKAVEDLLGPRLQNKRKPAQKQ